MVLGWKFLLLGKADLLYEAIKVYFSQYTHMSYGGMSVIKSNMAAIAVWYTKFDAWWFYDCNPCVYV